MTFRHKVRSDNSQWADPPKISLQDHSFYPGLLCVCYISKTWICNLSWCQWLCLVNNWTSPTHTCNLSPAPPAPLAYFFPAGVLFSTENAKGTTLNMPCHAILINKYAKQKQKVHQSKQQLCHLNQKNTPTKTPSTPSQSKDYANQNTKYAISTERIRQLNTKYAI